MSRSLRLEVAPPFDLEATVRVLQRRPVDRIDRLVDGAHLRLHHTAEGLVLAKVENRGTIDEPQLRLSFPSGDPSPALRRELAGVTRRVLGLDIDPAPFTKAALRIPTLRRLATSLRGMRPPRFPTLMEAIGRTVPYQQLSLDSGTAIVNRLIERFGPSLEWEGERWYVFPPEDILAAASPADFREVGFSLSKGRCLIDAAKELTTGRLSDEAIAALPTAEAYERLLSLWGIGPWTASLILLRGLTRLDAFPAGDVGVNHGLATILGEEPKGFRADRYAEAFGSQRGMLYFYSLGAQLLTRGLIGAG